jgi:hypothetical protein
VTRDRVRDDSRDGALVGDVELHHVERVARA